MAATNEAKIKAKLKKCLDALAPHVWYYMPVSTGYGKHGVPDFLICQRRQYVDPSAYGDGCFIAIETKANGGKPTALQAKQLTDIQAAGGTAIVVNENNIDQVITWLQLKVQNNS